MTIRPSSDDAGSGVAGPVAPPIFRRLGCRVWEIACIPDGAFPIHHPDPTVPDNLEQLIWKVKEEKADVGIAYDGDGDRLGVGYSHICFFLFYFPDKLFEVIRNRRIRMVNWEGP